MLLMNDFLVPKCGLCGSSEFKYLVKSSAVFMCAKSWRNFMAHKHPLLFFCPPRETVNFTFDSGGSAEFRLSLPLFISSRAATDVIASKFVKQTARERRKEQMPRRSQYIWERVDDRKCDGLHPRTEEVHIAQHLSLALKLSAERYRLPVYMFIERKKFTQQER